MKFIPIERRTGLTREDFIENYLNLRRPVVFTDLSKSWPATEKWTFEFLKKEHGDLEVPLVGPDFHKPGPNYMKSHVKMRFADYLDLLEKGPTNLRIFLWNVLAHAPSLADDVSNPTICDGWLDKFPFLFFGGAGAVTTLHYDIDCSHVFHTHFQSRKRIVLFDQNQNQFLYQHPFTVQSRVDPFNLDLEKYPAADRAIGHETILTHGETLFIPSQWWHHIVYLEGGFSISLRATDSIFTQAKGVFNLAQHFLIDGGMNRLLGPRWKNWKEQKAIERAENAK